MNDQRERFVELLDRALLTRAAYAVNALTEAGSDVANRSAMEADHDRAAVLQAYDEARGGEGEAACDLTRAAEHLEDQADHLRDAYGPNSGYYCEDTMRRSADMRCLATKLRAASPAPPAARQEEGERKDG